MMARSGSRDHARRCGVSMRQPVPSATSSERRMNIVPRAALLLAAAFLAACDAGAPAKPLPGDLTVSLAAPNTDGALLVSITGPAAVGSVQAAAPGAVVRARTQ